MGYIADLSRYDPLEAVDSYPDGVILNVEDPGFGAKRDRANSRGVPWGTYSWVYPGQGPQAAQRAADAGVGPLGAWLDYEQQGVSPSDLQQALARGEQLGIRIGVYTYLYILDSVAGVLGEHPLWLAYYPGGDTWQPSYSDTARARGALLHQFTSSNGDRDLSVVLDPARWSAWIGSTGDDEMTQEQLDTIGQWLKDTEGRIEQKLLDTLGQWEQDTRGIILAAVKGDQSALADAIVAKLPTTSGGTSLTKADVEAAVRNVLHSA